MPPLSDRILRIFPHRSEREVVRLDAEPVIARVHHDMSSRCVAVHELVHEAMGRNNTLTYLEAAIIISCCAVPFPTIARGIYFLPKTL